MRKLIFMKSEWEKLQMLSEAGYPREVCGLLFGKAIDGETQEVLKVVKLENILNGHEARLKELLEKGAVTLTKERIGRSGAFEFVIDPDEHYKRVLEADREGLEQVGLFHSHPDHPAAPSATDAAQPYLAGWSNIIAAVHKGLFKEARSYYRAEEKNPFQEENIIVK